MKAIILAAGTSSRLYPITLEKPKCLLEIAGKSIIERQLEILEEFGVQNIVVVTGYKANAIKEHLKKRVRYRHFKDYAKTNHLHTLHSVRNELNNETLCLFADLIFNEEIIERLIKSNFDYTLVIDSKTRPGTMRVKIKQDSIKEIGNHVPVEKGDGTFIGAAKFSPDAAKLLSREMEKLVKLGNTDQYYTIALESLAKKRAEDRIY